MAIQKGARNFVLGFIGLVAGGYGLWHGYAWIQVGNYQLRPLPVTRVNMVALNPEAGYRIIVANNMAQIVEVSDQAQGAQRQEIDANMETDTNPNQRRRLPMKDMLGAMQGDLESLGRFVMALNKLDENELPPDPVIWKKEDLERAFGGDATLRAKLERDLNVRLNGEPLDTIRPDALEIGIVVDFPVPIRLKIEGKEQTLVARVKAPFVAQFAKDVTRRIQERPEITDDLLRGTYLDEAQKILRGEKPREDVARSIRAKYREGRATDLAQGPEKVLAATTIILNNEQMREAQVQEVASNGRTLHNLNVSLNDEGMKRLWKYSRERRGFQVVLTVDGIPVAAPRFRDELVTHNVTISQLGDGRLAADAAEVINTTHQQGKQL